MVPRPDGCATRRGLAAPGREVCPGAGLDRRGRADEMTARPKRLVPSAVPASPAAFRATRKALFLCLALGLGWTAPAGAEPGPSPYAVELRTLHAHYHTDPARLDVVRAGLEMAVQVDPRLENLLALAQVSFIWGDVRAATRDTKLEAYERGREAARRAIALAPRDALAHFWYATNSARLGQTRGVLRSLFGLPEVREEIQIVLQLDPHLTAAYALAGYVYLEVPGIFGGDVEQAERMFRMGLAQDPHFTGMRVGLAKTLIRQGRIAVARRELQAVLAEECPSNPADWTLKDTHEARELLDSLERTS